MGARGTGAIFFGMLAFACTGLGGPRCPEGALSLSRSSNEAAFDPPRELVERYFQRRPIDELTAGVLVAKLRFYREPPLPERAPGRVYRVFALPTLGNAREGVITVESDERGVRLVSTQPVVCEKERDEGIALFVERRSLSRSEWADVDRCMDEAFWPAPTDDGVLGADGTTHLVEGARAGRYHALTRWGLGSGLHESADRRALHACIVRLEQLAGWREE